jgi:hypothetical protein
LIIYRVAMGRGWIPGTTTELFTTRDAESSGGEKHRHRRALVFAPASSVDDSKAVATTNTAFSKSRSSQNITETAGYQSDALDTPEVEFAGFRK